MSDVYHVDVRSQLPEARRALAALTRSASSGESGIDHLLSELVKVRVSAANGCTHCLERHRDEARRAGATDEQILAAEHMRLSRLDRRTSAALALASSLEGTPDPRAPMIAGATPMAAARRHFDEDEMASLIMTIIAIGAWNRAMIAAGA